MPSILGNGTSALLAFQRALNTTSHNIANATVEGYTRQRVELVNRPGEGPRSTYVGAGVRVDSITRLSDTLVTNRLLDSRGEIGRLQVAEPHRSTLYRLHHRLGASLVSVFRRCARRGCGAGIASRSH